MAAPQLKNTLKYKIMIQRGPLAGQNYSFDKEVVQIGRSPDNDLILSNDLRASRNHAEIRWDGVDLRITNISSKNFLAVNGSQVESAKLESGTIVVVGETEFYINLEGVSEKEIAEPKTKVNFVEAVEKAVPGFTQHIPVLQQTHSSPVDFIPPVNPRGMPASAHPSQNLARSSPRTIKKVSNSTLRFYVIVAVIGIAFAWLMSSNVAKKKELSFRSAEQIEKDIESSREEMKEFETRKEKLDNVQFRKAQENYIRGFRDYKQGNFGRAKESFQVVLNLDPENELATRYYQLAKLKFDELAKFHMLQGNRYREKKNWRMCKSSYFNVMTMVSNNQDPLFKEARQYYDQCSLAQEGRY
ncbi:MAG TPA: FHA domain-containing protein [Pseudobdellovibrionaceae bacterium]|jgi:pSer/pThr/pTyr-binding forkhead associated (FHA) protein